MASTINVEKIMEEIRADIKEKGYTEDMLSFQDVKKVQATGFQYNEQECINLVNCVNRDAFIPWYRDLGQGGVKGFFKKVIRKMLVFLIAPMSDEQNRFNSDVTQTLNQFMGYIDMQNNQIEKYKKDIQLLERKIASLEDKIKK